MSSDTPVVLISGANRGLGFATAKALALDHEYHVIIGSRSSKTGKEAADSIIAKGGSASSVQLDLDSDESIASAVNHITSTHGRLDVLINNAGILIDHLKDEMTTRQLFTRTFNANLISTACLTEACLPLLRKSAHPRLIFVSSSMGSLNVALDKNSPAYSFDYKAYDASKTAVNMIALNYVRILEDVGASVNIVCPGLVGTDLSEFTKQYGQPPEVGAMRIVELATAEKGGVTGTFSDRNGVVPW